MVELSKKHVDRLKDIKEKIKTSDNYFKDNCKRYNKFLNFVFNTSLSNDDREKLDSLQKPIIEFNVLEAMVSRLRGEFMKQEPSIITRAADGVPIEKLTKKFLDTMDLIEDHIREIFFDASNDSLGYKVYSDLLGGGFSVVEIYTDYINEMSMEHCIHVKRVFDVTLTGFDPLARESHKGDGEYAFQIIPKTKEEFKEEFGEEALKNMSFTRTTGSLGAGTDFNWSYKNQDQDIVLVADFYEKKRKKVKIAKLSNGHIMRSRDYKRLIEAWEESNVMEQAPIVLEERWTEVEHIERYRICGEQVLEHIVTDYKYLPLVFVDGNSVVLRQDESNASSQMTRPYVYHAEGIQRLKNFSGQTVACEIENMIQHKFKVSAESIPEDYQDAYTNVQQASVLVYNAFYKDNPDQPLPPPMEIQRTPTPQIVESTFMGSDQVTQSILGSYDGLLGISGQQISGVAIQQGAMQSNAAALPYLMGYIRGLNRIAQIIIDLIPKYYVTPRSLPIRTMDGKRKYKVINDENNPESLSMDYDTNDLQIRVEAGVNASVQKQVALDQIIKLTQANKVFGDFVNSKGLEIIIDNLDIRGVDRLKELAVEFMQEMQEAQKAAAEKGDPMLQIAQEQVNNEKEIEMTRIMSQREKAEGELATATARVAIEKQKADANFMQIMAQIQKENKQLALSENKMDSENARTAVELALDIAQSHHRE